MDIGRWLKISVKGYYTKREDEDGKDVYDVKDGTVHVTTGEDIPIQLGTVKNFIFVNGNSTKNFPSRVLEDVTLINFNGEFEGMGHMTIDNTLKISGSDLSSLEGLNVTTYRLKLDKMYNIESLRGCPKTTLLWIDDCLELTSLEGIHPKIKSLIVNNTGIDSLKHIPQQLREIAVTNSMITNLDYLTGDFDHVTLGDNQINTISNVGFSCNLLEVHNNKLTDIKDSPNCNYLDVSDNKITSLEGMGEVTETLIVSGNRLSNMFNMYPIIETVLFSDNPIQGPLFNSDVKTNKLKATLSESTRYLFDERYVVEYNDIEILNGMMDNINILDNRMNVTHGLTVEVIPSLKKEYDLIVRLISLMGTP